jgi:hypothetical protein
MGTANEPISPQIDQPLHVGGSQDGCRSTEALTKDYERVGCGGGSSPMCQASYEP